jgi:hypothetical protein
MVGRRIENKILNCYANSEMQYIVGIIVGAIITGIAMILNSYFNARTAREKEQRDYSRINNDKYISDLESIYEEALHSLDKMIRDKGRASAEDLERFYRLGIQLDLKSTEKIINGFANLRHEITVMAKNLPALPEEFIPDFERDEERKYRLETRRKAEQKRDNEAKKYTGADAYGKDAMAGVALARKWTGAE